MLADWEYLFRRFGLPSLDRYRFHYGRSCEAPRAFRLGDLSAFTFGRGGGKGGDSADLDRDFQPVPASVLRSLI